jgi:hypothetical protein
VTRLGEILPFRLLFKGTSYFEGKIWLVVGIFRVQKGFDLDVLDFQIEL